MGTTSTVRFNVRGTKYEVSRSLVEQYPDTLMAKIVSEKWSDNDDVLFIEGDGERFKYVLDFMRDGTISLPGKKESKDAFLKDLEYYGFTNVDSDGVQVCWDVGGAIDCLASVEKLVRDKEVDLFTEWQCTVVASHCYELYRASNCNSGSSFINVPPHVLKNGLTIYPSNMIQQPHFAQCLRSLYQLKVDEFENNRMHLSSV